HHVPCNSCSFCLSDRHTVCPYIKETYFDPGGFSEYIRLPEINVDRGTFLLDDSVSYDEGSFVEPLGCVVRGHRVAGFKVGMSVAVIGSGITGLLNLQYAISQGAGYTCSIDINEFKLNSAKRFGADQTFTASDTNISEKIKQTLGTLIDFVIVCTGVESAIEQALSITEKGGTILFFAPSNPEYELKTNFNNLWWSGIKIVSSYAAAPKDLQLALKLIQYNKVNVLDMITHRLPLSEAKEGFNLVEKSKDSLKVIINPNS
ncbi:MAG: zinc-binding dehydrogenase, partial [Thermodesulfobacteriota bacterium]